MKKVWKKAFSDYQNIEIIDYDFDDDEEKLKDLNIGNILPLLIFYKESKEIKRIAGEKSLKQMQEILSEIYDA
jgi:hypothetical protein